MDKRAILRRFTSILTVISPTLTSKFYYMMKVGKKLNLKNPKTFNEKLMWAKLNCYKDDTLVIKCADKYLVRDYIKDSGCEELLNDLIGVYNTVDEIDFDKLPNQFVLKINNAAGYNIICSDKTKLDVEKVKKTLNKWLKNPYWKFYAEVHYKEIPVKIVCEKFLETSDGNAIEDYKFYCFQGKPLFCMVCVGRNLGKPKYYFMSKDWELMRINPAGINAPDDFSLAKPKCIDEMYKYAEILSKPFEFVRVDFYSYQDKTIFGELTFTPCACADGNYTDAAQIEFGEKINIENFKRKNND